MSALEELRKNLGTAPVAKPLDSDIQKRGTTQPVVAPKSGSALDSLRANLNSSAPAIPSKKPVQQSEGILPAVKNAYDVYSNQAIRKVASFDAGFIQSVGQLARSFQWLGDRVVGDRIVQDSSDELLQADLKAQDDLLKLYRKKRDSGDVKGAKKVMEQLKTANKNQIPYEAYADTNDSIFYKAQDKTKEWADVLRSKAGITPENSTFSDRLFEGAGSSATYFVPSLGIAKGASVLAKVSPRIAMLFGGSAGASLEAMAEAGSTFDEWKKKGDLQKAGEESSKVFLANAILLAVSNNLGVFNPAKLGILKRALLSSPVEGLQEAVQQVIQNEANNRPLWEGVLEAGAIGGIIGSVMGGVTDAVTTQTNETEEGYTKPSQASGIKPDGASPAITALREQLKVTPAIEQQRALEGTPEGVTTVKKTEIDLPEADVRLPETVKEQKTVAFSEFEKLAKRVETLEDLNKAIDNADIDNLDDVVQFHGTQSEGFGKALKEGTVRASTDGVIGKGFYVTNTPETATYFGKQVKIGNAREMNGGTPTVYAIDMRELNIMKLPYGKQEYYDFLEKKGMTQDEYNEALFKKGYDGLNLEGRGETVIFNTSKLRELDMSQFIKEPKTQTELVKEAVSSKPKTIKQVAKELGIKEPNVRRILGQGAKSGTFERVEKGVYILNNGKEDIAFIHTADAIETLPKLAKEGLKVDMVFLDIPYDTPAVKGGSRGVKYNLISVDDFRKVMSAVSDIVRTDETPVYYMYSQADSGKKAMEEYNKVLDESGFKAVAKGEYQKMFGNGKPVTNVRGVVAKPEGIILLNKKGEFIEKDKARNLDFTLRRPKGYSTEKPVELLNSLILQGTKEGDTVLDPFAGSGVTGAEAVKTGRKTVLIEKNEEVAENITKPRVKEAVEEKKSQKYGSLRDFIRSKQPEKVTFISATKKEDYMGGHEAPMAEDINAPIWDLTGKYTGNNLYPKDIYSQDAYRLYSAGEEYDGLAMSILQSVKYRPNAKITIYRAVSKSSGSQINVGDWVTTTRQYAKDHGESNLNGDYKILKKEVHARDIFTDANSIHEFGYDPQPRLKPENTPFDLLEKYIGSNKPNVYGQYISQLTSAWEKSKKENTDKPETSEEATDRYWNEVINPQIEKGEAVVIGADDLKYYFGNDFDINRHSLYSKSANQLFERAVTQSKEPVVKFVAGGTGSGKSDFIVPDISEDFSGVIYDSTAWNPEGLFKQMEFVKSQGKTSKVYGIVPDLRRSRAYTLLREESGKHPVTEQAFVNTHTGSIQTMLKVIEQGGDVYVLDTRTLTTPEQVEGAEYVHNPVALLEGARYSKDYVTEQIKDVTSETAREIVSEGQGITEDVPKKDRANEELVLETQEPPKENESRTQTEVQGQKINRFTGLPQDEANPRIIGQTKPLVTKTGLKTIFSTTPAFRENPILVVAEIPEYQEDRGRGRTYLTGEKVKRLTWESPDGKTKFALAPSALGLVTENLNVGDKVRVSRETLSRKGQEFRVIKYDADTGKGSAYASVGRYRDGSEVLYKKPENLRPIQFPELVALAKELSGNAPFIKRYTKANGMFYARDNGEIGLNPVLFKRENLRQLQATLAHEIGHLTDYLPDHTMKRGNLMGRLNTLKGFMKEFYEPAGVSRTNTELRDQMYELSKYWRPYEEETASESFKAYRKSAPEIYADFISALFNEPKTVSEIAPTAYNVFFEKLDRKPAVKEAYFELQELLRNGDVTASRRSATTEMFKLTEQESKERQIQNEIEQESKKKSIWFKFKTQAVDITEAVKEKVKEVEKSGKKINDDDNPTYYLEERNYLGGKIRAEVDKKFNSIYQDLQANDLTWEDLGELMFYERVLKGDRQEIANPLGYQPDFVQDLMEVYEDVGQVKPDADAHQKGTSDMKTTLGEEKYAKLQELANTYRENLKGFFKEGYTEGIYSDELNQLFNENAFYVPFKGAKYSGVTRTSFGVKSQKGTLDNIENPANTGIEKAVSIIRAIERNRVTRKTITFLQENFAEEVTPAKTDKNGYPIEPKEKDLSLVTYMQDGKVKGFYVDKYVGEAIKKNTVAEQNLIIDSLRFVNSRLFRPLFITFNLGFQTFNLIRDFKRFWKNVPNMTILRAMKLYSQSARASKIRAFGLPKNPSEKDIEAYNLINRLESEQLLSLTYNDIIKGEDIEDAQIDRILREVGVRQAEQTKLGAIGDRLGLTKQSPIIKQALGIMEFVENLGNMIETLPKVAGVKALEDKMPPREMRSFVRRYVGSPDFMAGGKFKPYANEIFLFSNAIFQGIRSDYEIATQPKSRGAYWLKTAQSELVPKLLMLMATAGFFGEWLKEAFAKISEYDKTNYTVVPMGIDQNGKVIYLRVPSDESGRLIGGAFWKVANAVKDTKELAELDTYTDLLSYAGGQVPSVTPTITTTYNIADFLAGNNPHDFFRNRPVLTTEQMQAGGMEKTKPFLFYLFQQMGGGVVMKLYTNEQVPSNPSLSEKISSLPVVGNIAGRFIKASDYGEVERIKEVSDEVRSARARENIANRRIVFSYVEQSQGMSYGEAQALKREMIKEVYDGFPKTPEDRVQARNLEKRFDTLRLRGSADTRVDALITAPSNEEKVALLQEYKRAMSIEQFAELKQFIIKNRVVSSAVFQAFNRVEK